LDGLMRSADHDQPYLPYQSDGGVPQAPPSAPGPAWDHDQSYPPYRQTGEVPAQPIVQGPIWDLAEDNEAAADMFDAGRFDEAVPLFEQVLASCRNVLGNEHPGTMTVAGNLAVAYFAAGNRRKGLKHIVNNVSDRARLLGDEHPDTLVARNALATAHRLTGDADRAIALAKQVVVQRTRTLGPAHGDTLTSRMVLALALAAAGDLNSADRMIGSTMSDAESTFGAQHPHTLALLDCGVENGLLRG
jgi:hypothetical protein